MRHFYIFLGLGFILLSSSLVRADLENDAEKNNNLMVTSAGSLSKSFAFLWMAIFQTIIFFSFYWQRRPDLIPRRDIPVYRKTAHVPMNKDHSVKTARVVDYSYVKEDLEGFKDVFGALNSRMVMVHDKINGLSYERIINSGIKGKLDFCTHQMKGLVAILEELNLMAEMDINHEDKENEKVSEKLNPNNSVEEFSSRDGKTRSGSLKLPRNYLKVKAESKIQTMKVPKDRSKFTNQVTYKEPVMILSENTKGLKVESKMTNMIISTHIEEEYEDDFDDSEEDKQDPSPTTQIPPHTDSPVPLTQSQNNEIDKTTPKEKEKEISPEIISKKVDELSDDSWDDESSPPKINVSNVPPDVSTQTKKEEDSDKSDSWCETNPPKQPQDNLSEEKKK